MAEQYRLAFTIRGRGSTEITDDVAAIIAKAAVDTGIAQAIFHTDVLKAGVAVCRQLYTLIKRSGGVCRLMLTSSYSRFINSTIMIADRPQIL